MLLHHVLQNIASSISNQHITKVIKISAKNLISFNDSLHKRNKMVAIDALCKVPLTAGI